MNVQLIDFARRAATVIGVGVLALAGLVAPAHATTVPAVNLAVTWENHCDGRVTATVASERKVVALVKVTGAAPFNVAAGGKASVAVPGYGKGELAATYLGLGGWRPLGKAHEWTLPRWCKPAKPTIVVTLPTCDKPATGLTIANPNKAIPVKVRIGAGQAVTVDPGKSTTADLTAHTWIRWGVKLPIWKLDHVKHKPATCPTPTPTATATTGPSPTPTATSSASPTPTSTETGSTTPTSPAPLPTGTAPAPGQVPVGNNDTDPQGGLPITGVNVGVLVTVGALILLAGAAGVVATRRKRTRFTA